MDIKTIIKIISEKENISYEEAEIEFDKIWNKPIDEEKLDELAKEKYPEDNEFYFERSKYIDGWVDKNEGKRKAFKAGYRKAKEE